MSEPEMVDCRLCGAQVTDHTILNSENNELIQKIRQTYALVVSDNRFNGNKCRHTEYVYISVFDIHVRRSK